MDVTDEDSMKNGIARILLAEGHIDVLVNNAGYGSYVACENGIMTLTTFGKCF